MSKFVTQMLAFNTQAFNFLATAFKFTAFTVQFLQDSFHMHMLLVQEASCLHNNIFCQTKASTNIEGITATRHAHQQTISGTQRNRVKFYAGIFHTFVTVSKSFQFTVVSSNHCQHFVFMQMFKHRHCKSSTFVGVSTSADFVNKHQVPTLHFAQNANQISHMCGEGTQALFNALFITNIRINRTEHRQLRTACRDEHTGLRHQSEKTNCF